MNALKSTYQAYNRLNEYQKYLYHHGKCINCRGQDDRTEGRLFLCHNCYAIQQKYVRTHVGLKNEKKKEIKLVSTLLPVREDKPKAVERLTHRPDQKGLVSSWIIPLEERK